MTESEIYKGLSVLTKSRDKWEESIPYVSSLLGSESVKIQAKALWLLGEMGLLHPEVIAPYVEKIASFLSSHDDLLRERALNALGRIGRTRFNSVKPHFEKMLGLAADSNPRVRLAFIWASENIATNTPDPYGDHMAVFAELLHDSDDRVRMEAPEMFRVLGKRCPKFVKPFLNILQWMAEHDAHPVVRIHCAGAVRIIEK